MNNYNYVGMCSPVQEARNIIPVGSRLLLLNDQYTGWGPVLVAVYWQTYVHWSQPVRLVSSGNQQRRRRGKNRDLYWQACSILIFCRTSTPGL